MPIVDRYRGPNINANRSLPYSSPVVGVPLRRLRGLGWLPFIQPAGMPAVTGHLAGLGDDLTPLDTVLEATRDIVNTGLDIYETVDTATGSPRTVVRTSTVRTAPAIAGGTGLILAGIAALYFLGGKRGRRR